MFPDASYHNFADPLGGFVSNIAFLAVGLAGVRHWRRQSPYQSTAFLGCTLTALGSAWYHWRPNDATLVWDRLPMTIVFASVFAQALGSFCSEALARRWFGPMLLAGLASVALWAQTGVIVPYAIVQFGPLLAIPILMIWNGKRAPVAPWFWLLGLYVLAKIFEMADGFVFTAAMGWVGGHTLKHLAAAAALWAWAIATRAK